MTGLAVWACKLPLYTPQIGVSVGLDFGRCTKLLWECDTVWTDDFKFIGATKRAPAADSGYQLGTDIISCKSHEFFSTIMNSVWSLSLFAEWHSRASCFVQKHLTTLKHIGVVSQRVSLLDWKSVSNVVHVKRNKRGPITINWPISYQRARNDSHSQNCEWEPTRARNNYFIFIAS